MSIHDYLSEEQINKINTVIRIQCEQAAHNDAVERNRIPTDLYDKLKKGRKAHDVTGDIYVALFYQENAIEGLNMPHPDLYLREMYRNFKKRWDLENQQ